MARTINGFFHSMYIPRLICPILLVEMQLLSCKSLHTVYLYIYILSDLNDLAADDTQVTSFGCADFS